MEMNLQASFWRGLKALTQLEYNKLLLSRSHLRYWLKNMAQLNSTKPLHCLSMLGLKCSEDGEESGRLKSMPAGLWGSRHQGSFKHCPPGPLSLSLDPMEAASGRVGTSSMPELSEGKICNDHGRVLSPRSVTSWASLRNTTGNHGITVSGMESTS